MRTILHLAVFHLILSGRTAHVAGLCPSLTGRVVFHPVVTLAF